MPIHRYEYITFRSVGLDYNKLKALLRGGAQGASLGFADEIKGGVDAASQAVSNGSLEGLGDAYSKGRDEYRKNDLTAKESAPNYYMGGELAGGLASAVAMPGGAMKAPGMMKALAQAAGYGGAYGLGSSEASDLSGMAADAAKGAATGAALAPLASLAGRAAGMNAPKALPQVGRKSAGTIGTELGEMAAQMKYGSNADAANRISDTVGRKLQSNSVADNYANEIMQRKAAGLVDDAATVPGTTTNILDDSTDAIIRGLSGLKGR